MTNENDNISINNNASGSNNTIRDDSTDDGRINMQDVSFGENNTPTDAVQTLLQAMNLLVTSQNQFTQAFQGQRGGGNNVYNNDDF
jgi:hypothetical protein